MNIEDHEVRVVADAPSKTDLLGFSSAINTLLSVIKSPNTVTPFTIGILGDWGVGKSTLMMQLANKLSDNNYPVVVFNPWKYDDREELLNALVQTILLTFIEDEGRKHDINSVKKVVMSFSRMIASSAVSKMSGGIVDLNKIIDDYSNMSSERVEFINRFESVFGQLVDEYAGNERIVVFIDDLDRCIPENSIKVLEAIKLFLSVPKCFFVIGLEQEVIQEGIKHRYGDSLGFSGKDYLEKIIQLPFKVPTPSSKNIANFVDYISGDRIGSDVKDIAVYGSESNPRRIKRFLNSFEILREIIVLEKEVYAERSELKNSLLAFILMLEIRFPEHYSYYSKNLKDCTQLLEILSQKKYFENDEINRIASTNSIYAELLKNNLFQRFLKNVLSSNSVDFSLGDEGLIEYFTLTRATSSIKSDEDVQQYFLPEFRVHGSVFNFGGGPRDLILLNAGDKKIEVIKEIRAITGLGLKEAKKIADTPNSIIKENIKRGEEEQFVKLFKEVGATVEVK